ncbi:MAG: histidinol dehydrogenase [Oscillibacter sp.]|nr:histidinol dehydrogenase [Oscillibacter sp.]
MMNVENWDGAEALFRRERARTDPEVSAAVARILEDVRTRGDAALHEYTQRFDGVDVESFQVPPEALEAAYDSLDAGFQATLLRAAANIEHFHAQQIRRDYALTDKPGILLGLRHIPMERVGICVPKSPTAFPSTILMNAIPARLAGVHDILIVTPPAADGSVSAAALGAAYVAAQDVRVYTIGGAQAVAALAYGTESVPAVDKIVGPGGVFVAEAKRQVFGQVGIDLIAGPSEILVLADESANPRHVAADMLSQAEHDTHAAAVLVTDSRIFAGRVALELERQISALPRADIARESLERNGKLYVTDSLQRAVEAANRIAPEHLELCVTEPLSLLPLIRNAGSVFLGHNAPEALGDYFAGPNHTLPTSGTARFSGPLSVDDFVKKSSYIYYTRDALKNVAENVADFAEREGLRAHARSVLVRGEETS